MGGGLSTILMIVALGGAFFFMQRSSKKQQQERQNTLNAMKTGDNVVTIGGLHGVLSEVNSDTVIIDCEGVYLEFDRSAIRTVKPAASVQVDEDVTVETPSEVITPTDEADETKD